MKRARNRFVKNLRYLCLVGVITLGLISIVGSNGGGGGGGGGGGDGDSMPADQKAKLNPELTGYPTWEEFAAIEDDSTDSDPPSWDVSNSGVLCTTTSYSMTMNPDEIVTFGTAPDVFYLGSLIQGDSYLGGLLSMVELPIRQRAPLTIAIKVLTGTDITRTVEDPDAASVQQALSDIVAEAEESGHDTGRRSNYVYEQSYSSEQAALNLGFSFKYMGSSGQAALEFDTSEETNTVTAYFKQIMFEAYIVRPQTPAEFFSADFTEERLEEQKAQGNIGPDNLPVYVARIQYGRILMYSMTATCSAETLKMAAKYGYEGWGADVSAEMRAEVQDVLNTAEIKVAAVGGNEDNVKSMLRSCSLADYFTSDDPLTSAEPIAYALCNLADGSTAVVSETTEYDVRECGGGATCYLDKDAWKDAVEAMNLQYMEWLTTPGNFCYTNEVKCASFGYPEGEANCGSGAYPNMGMGPVLTFDSSNTGFPFTFYLHGPESGNNGLVYKDLENYKPAFGSMDQERSISIGDCRWEKSTNDDFEIGIRNRQDNCHVFAIGITVGDNEKEDGELIRAYYKNGGYDEYNQSPDCENTHGFIGIVSYNDLSGIFFDERGGSWSDNIFVRDPCFGVLEWPVDEP